MEAHPVPQNVLEVEFKLFGAFTLKQFLRILFGCLFALFIFLLELPFYIKFPVMGASVLIGIGLAIMPNFGIWLSGFLKALFISPRYVWIKETRAPEVFKGKAKANVQNTQHVNKQKKKNPDLSEISLEKLLGAAEPSTRGYTSVNQNEVLEGNENVDRILNEVYQQKSSMPQFNNRNVQMQNNAQIQQDHQIKTKEDYANEINRLKYELSNLVKDQRFKARESEILARINDLYQEMRFAQNDNIPKVPAKLTTVAQTPIPVQKPVEISNEKGEVLNKGQQNIFGILLDKSGKPVADALIKFDNPENENDFITRSNSDGRFITTEKLPFGTYNVTIEHPSIKFHTYKIVVGPNKLPAYKLRAK